VFSVKDYEARYYTLLWRPANADGQFTIPRLTSDTSFAADRELVGGQRSST
jgi:hypothetical protein